MDEKHDFKYRRADWRRPPAQLLHADLLLRIFDDRIEGSETLTFEAREDLAELALDAQDLEIGAVSFRGDGKPSPCAARYDAPGRKLHVALPAPVAAGGRFALRIAATCRPTQNVLDGAYFDTTPPGAPPQIVSQCQQWGFQRILPIVDDCTAKCTWRTELQASARYTHLVTNGDVDRSVCPDGRPVPLPGDPSRVRIVYANPVPMPPYLFLVAAGTWDALADSVRTPAGREVRLEYLVPPGLLDGARLPMAILKDAVLFQAREVGYDYDRECYRTICMEKSNFGGMENVGNTTIVTEAALLDRWTTDRRLFYAFGVIVHEYEHNHCGSDVTMETPFDMWLNEAYTVTVERAYLAARFGAAFARLDDLDGLRDPLRGPLAQEDGGAAAFPIVRDGFDSPDDVVDGVTYDKVPEVLGMLREWLGRDAYRAATDAYFARHRGGNAGTADFLAAFESGGAGVPPADLRAFFRQWLFTVGYPELAGSWSWDPAARRLSVTLSQTRRGSSAEPFVVPFRVRGVDARGRAMPCVDRLLVLRSASETFVFEDVPEAPAFLDWNSGLPFYGTFRDDTATPDSLALAARVSPFPVGRVEAWRAVVDLEMARAIGAPDAVAPGEAFLSLLAAALGDRSLDPGIRARLLEIPEEMLDRACVPRFAERAAAARALRRVAAAHLGADRLLAAYADARAAAGTAVSADIAATAAALPRRAVARAIGALLALTGDPRAWAALRDSVASASCVGEELAAVAALQEAGAPGFRDDLRALGERCRPHVGAWAAWLSLVASDPDPDAVFGEIARVERDPGFRPEHPSHARYLYGALARNHAALWTPRGLAWLEEKLVATAAVNENVAILLLGALQLRRGFAEPLRTRTRELLLRVADALTAAAPGATALLARVRALAREPL